MTTKPFDGGFLDTTEDLNRLLPITTTGLVFTPNQSVAMASTVATIRLAARTAGRRDTWIEPSHGFNSLCLQPSCLSFYSHVEIGDENSILPTAYYRPLRSTCEVAINSLAQRQPCSSYTNSNSPGASAPGAHAHTREARIRSPISSTINPEPFSLLPGMGLGVWWVYG